MIKDEYKKTIVVWTDSKPEQKILVKIIRGLKFNPVIIATDNVQDVLKVHCFLIFATGRLVQADFFDTRKTALRSGELTCVFIDDSRPYPNFSPKSVIQLDISKPDEVKNLIKKKSKEIDLFSKRRLAMEQKLKRLFYIYTILKETGSIRMEDVIFRAKISKRTFYRDIETIKDICVDMRIESSGTTGDYWVAD